MLARTWTLLWCRDFQCEQGGAAPPYRARSGATDNSGGSPRAYPPLSKSLVLSLRPTTETWKRERFA